MNHIKKGIAAGMISVLGISSFSSEIPFRLPKVSAAAKTDSVKSVDFSDMKYEHFDTTEYYNTIKQVKKLMKEKGNYKKIKKDIIYLLKCLNQISNESTQVGLYNSLNVNDKYYQDEYQYCTSTSLEMQDAFINLLQQLKTSLYSKELKKEIKANQTLKELFSQEPLTKKQHKLITKENSLILKYYELSTDDYTTTVHGETLSIDEIQDRKDIPEAERNSAIKEIKEKRNKALGDIYVELVKIRQQLAKSYGYNDYSDYCYKELYNRDYTTRDSQVLCESVKSDLSSYYMELQNDIYNNPDYDKLDDTYGNLDASKIYTMASTYLPCISSSLVKSYNFMQENHLCDIEYNKDKANGGFTTFLPKYCEPFICIQPNESFTDFTTFIHEFGHFNNSYVNIQDNFNYNNLDLAEIHSQGLELLFTKYYDKLFEKKDAKLMADFKVYDMVDSIVVGCLYDEFQRRVYKLDQPTLAQINEIYTKLCKEYNMIPKDSDTIVGWEKIGHNFDAPLYYISYGISAAPTLEIWQNSLTNYEDACKTYLEVVKHGEHSTYKQTLKECGLTSPFTEGYCTKLVSTLKTYFVK